MFNLFLKTEFFSSLKHETLRKLASLAEPLHVAPKTAIFNDGDPADLIYLLQSGQIKLCRRTMDGQQVVQQLLRSQKIFGDTSIFYDDIYPYSAESIEACSLIRLPLATFSNLIRTDIEACNIYIHHLSQHMDGLARDLEHHAFQYTAQRLGCYILLNCLPQTEGLARTTIPFEKSLVAAQLGMQPETFSRAISRLCRDQGITISAQNITVPDIQALSRYVCRACTKSFPCIAENKIPPQT